MDNIFIIPLVLNLGIQLYNQLCKENNKYKRRSTDYFEGNINRKIWKVMSNENAIEEVTKINVKIILFMPSYIAY